MTHHRIPRSRPDAPFDPGSWSASVPVGPDTYLLRQVQEVHGAHRWVCANSMVITGAQPIIVTTARIAGRSQWLDGVFGIVEPTDLRWVYLSGDDFDHAGNLAELLAACPQAMLVADRAALRRNTGTAAFPLDRYRFVDDGDSFEAGDRRLLSAPVPAWSAPSARGLLDQRTGIYWAADTFGCLLPGEPVRTVAELDPEVWADGMALFAHHLLGPWLDLVDHRRFSSRCDRIRALGMTTIASAHSPLITDTSIDHAFRLLRDLPATPAPPWPGQRPLDTLVSTHRTTEKGQDQ